ncbi:MAG: V-type ATP synthase subunit E family protein [Candidatus Heimdallarchaeota archaeon]
MEEAEKKVKEINQSTLFQKAEIKKNYLKRMDENSLRIKNHFIETYDQFLNNTLSETLSKVKDEILQLKRNLIEQLYSALETSIRNKISKNYSKYTKYLISIFKKVISIIDKPPKISISLNSKDYDYFKTNPNHIQDLFKNKVEILKSNDEFIGGFKVFQNSINMSYDYTIDNLLQKKSILIEKEFSKIFSESEIKEMQLSFEKFIRNKKLDIKEHLRTYD